MKERTIDSLMSSLESIYNSSECTDFFEKFHITVCEIGKLKNPDSSSFITRFLNDESEEDLMFAIIHTIETFDDEIYVREILGVCIDLYLHSPEWASIIFRRIINNDRIKNEMIKQLNCQTLVLGCAGA